MVIASGEPWRLIERAALSARPEQIQAVVADAAHIAAVLRQGEHGILTKLISKVQVLPERIAIELTVPAIAAGLELDLPPDAPEVISLSADARVRRSGMAVRLVQQNGVAASPGQPQQHLIALIAKARQWWGELQDEGITVTELASRHGVTRSWVSRTIRLAFLAPDIVNAILAGSQPAALDAARLLALTELPLDWPQQQRMLQMI